MRRLLPFLFTLPVLMLLAGCASLDSTAGTGGIGGGDGRIVDPEPKTRSIGLRCTNNLDPDDIRTVLWELTVDPGPIVSGEPFAVDFRAIALFDAVFIDAGQLAIEGGFKRVELLDLQATVRIREGATGPDVVLAAVPLERTCTYDDNGSTGPEAGRFPPCAQENDNPDGSNDDCMGLGAPAPDNRCRQFVDIPTSDDCARGGLCDSLDGGFGFKSDECEANGFCVSDSLEVPLQGSLEGYRAAASGSVLFGWDDQGTGAEVLPPAVFDEPVGPNGFRVLAAGLPAALECTMGVRENIPDGMGGIVERWVPSPDTSLISFPIQAP